MQTLIQGTSSPYFGQPGVLFLDQKSGTLDENATRMVFSSQFLDSGNKVQYQIHELNLFTDFKEVLTKLGFMPEVSISSVIRLEE